MNVLGELQLVAMVVLAAAAGAIIGWCIRSFSGGGEKKARQHFARDVDEAVKDTRLLRSNLASKEEELQETRHELLQLRRKGNSTDSDTRVQVTEINELKNQLAAAKRTLHNNQTEFNTYRTEAQKDQNELRNEISKYTAGGTANTERLNDANETIGALRSAVRENDKVIDSLRARVKEGDSTVENLRSQLKSAESGRREVENVKLEYNDQLEGLSKTVESSHSTIEKQKRDYDLMLENKNRDIKSLQTKIEEMISSTSSMKTREHELTKLNLQHDETELEFKATEKKFKETETGYKSEIVNLKRVISDRDQALSKARQQSTDLKAQIKAAKEHEEQEVQRLQLKVKDATENRSKIRSKSAEVAALNDMLSDSASKRDSLQGEVNNLQGTLSEREASINSLRSDMDDVVASRNKLSSQLGELQTKGNVALEKLQEDLNSLANTRDEYQRRIASLQQEVTELKDSKESSKLKEEKLKGESKVWQNEAKQLNVAKDEYKSRIVSLQTQISDTTKSKDGQLLQLRNQLSASSDASEKQVREVTSDFSKRNTMLHNDLKTLQAKLKEQTLTIDNLKSGLKNQTEINKRAATKLAEKQNKLTEFRSRLNKEESESQRLNHQLSEAESVKLTLTERDAELRRTQIELQDAKINGGPMQAALTDQQQQNDSLLKALQERDEELSRVNTQITNHNLRNKQQQSSITLLNQEKESQTELVKSLEKQAENTLQLHTKIAQQSTELENLRARLYERDNTSNSHGNTQTQVDPQQADTRQSAATKPRVFVRADTEALTGATGYQTTKRPLRADGSDDLSLLPGITQTVAGALNKHGITAFEQIANWGDREIAHYSERVGIPVVRAQEYNWPKAASGLLDGTYSKDSQGIDH